MRKTLVIIGLLLAAVLHAEDSPLVKAANAGKATKKKSTKKVITNADVKKSTGTLKVLPAKNGQQPAAATAATTTAPAKTSTEKKQQALAASNAAAKRVATAESSVNELQQQLQRIEQTYYETNDPNYRDTEVKQRFDQTKRQLDDARKELADARDAQKRLSAPPAKSP